MVNRYYDPTTGQFLSIDPLVAGTHQPYQYAEDDPVNGSDPTGLGAGVSAGTICGEDGSQSRQCKNALSSAKHNMKQECASDPTACSSNLPPVCSLARNSIASSALALSGAYIDVTRFYDAYVGGLHAAYEQADWYAKLNEAAKQTVVDALSNLEEGASDPDDEETVAILILIALG